ncbi:PAS domain-containing sensor histidine kinase [Endozoicomonas sp. SM1973]|uniref:histidine kinase n=1 Tax=Spartinivicinus marinus TaxID=2994442 RepID=A0A853I6J6_9GAMM|nr:ATP-binding protein [Spartinivicinus marinus]MCX4025584.1 ATP-binding protein [Spartinivicinus marinus]NYZ65187.1 PAS domain-containing sensor histidine kinase [Spartinivicinus marinus]
MNNKTSTGPPANLNLRVLRIYNLYRTFLGLVLTLSAFSPINTVLFNPTNLKSLQLFAVVYLFINIIVLISIHHSTSSPVTFCICCTDILLLSLLLSLQTSKNLAFGNLVVVSVAAGNILIRGKLGLLLAAIASLCIVVITLFRSTQLTIGLQTHISSGLLGIIYFATAFFIQSLSERLSRSEALAEQRRTEFFNLQKLNQVIIQRMRTGILVISHDQLLVMMNEAAKLLLNSTDYPKTLEQASPQLKQALTLWQNNPRAHIEPFQATSASPKVKASFTRLPVSGHINTLVFLDDISLLTQQAQQLKLASLGRLTASIAHEIRNPLGAISHAAQLLNESPDITSADIRLIEIIQNHSKRVNNIIENILQVAKRKQTQPETFLLEPWLKKHLNEEHFTNIQSPVFDIQNNSTPIEVVFDPHQLSQIVTNLCQNGLRYSYLTCGEAYIKIITHIKSDTGQPCVDIIDKGPGIQNGLAEQVFEPFYTTETTGTGLGLYISRELCEANQASLDLIKRSQGGCCFRITFAHPQRNQSYLEH